MAVYVEFNLDKYGFTSSIYTNIKILTCVMKWDDCSSNYSWYLHFYSMKGLKEKQINRKSFYKANRKKKDSIQSVNKEENDHEDLSKLLT